MFTRVFSLSGGDPDLVHDFHDARGDSGDALRHQTQEVSIRLFLREVQLETILDLKKGEQKKRGGAVNWFIGRR